MLKKFSIVLLILVIISITFNVINLKSIKEIKHNMDVNSTDNSNLLSKTNELETEIHKLKEEKEIMESSLSFARQSTNINHYMLREQIKLLNLMDNKEFLSKNTIIPIYSKNIDDYSDEIILFTYLPHSYTLKEKLNRIRYKLSEYCFNTLPIELVEIKEIDNKKVAIINLMESEFNKEITWAGSYFQGTTGGSITSHELIETFLQRDYKGEWIDGVKFLYEGSDINKFEHVERLSEVIYRGSVK